MENSYKFFSNKDCKYFPCHKNFKGEDFNCLFCYCPLNCYEDCLGNPSYIIGENNRKIKNCTNCDFPHNPENYELIIDFIRKKNTGHKN